MQSDFIQYLRSETKKVSVIVLIGMIIVTLIMTALFLSYTSDDVNINTIRYILVAHSFPTLLLAITIYLSRRIEKMVEMLGLCIIIPTIIIVIISNTTDVIHIDQDSRNI